MQTTSNIFRNSAILLGLSFALTAPCFGDMIFLTSSATTTQNNSNSATINIAPNPSWSAPFEGTSWISNVQSGDPNAPGYVSPANGTSVTFTTTFNINGTPILGSLIVMADDTASVTLNGIQLTAAAPTQNNTFSTCSNFTIGCTVATRGGFNLLGDLHSGTNTLSFTVQQIAGSSFGLDYSAAIGSTGSTVTPEPGTLALLSIPVCLAGIIRFRKKKA